MRIYIQSLIYDASGDLSKRWYVYFYYRNPVTGKLKLQPPLYMGVNRSKSKVQRMEQLIVNRKVLHELLKQGYNPYETHQETDKRLKEEKVYQQLEATESQQETYTVKEALAFALSQKKTRWAEK